MKLRMVLYEGFIYGVDFLENKKINRKLAREKAFLFLFERNFNHYEYDELVEIKSACEENFKVPVSFTKELFLGTVQNKCAIDELIDKYSKSWSNKRISKVTGTILNLAIFEMLFRNDVPDSVAINEAVELAKKYGSSSEPAFINGILGSISRKEKPNE